MAHGRLCLSSILFYVVQSIARNLKIADSESFGWKRFVPSSDKPKHTIIITIIGNYLHSFFYREWRNPTRRARRFLVGPCKTETGGLLNKVLYGEAPPRGPNPNPYIPFLREKVPLSYTFRRKFSPFHIPTERVLLNSSFDKALKILRWFSR